MTIEQVREREKRQNPKLESNAIESQSGIKQSCPDWQGSNINYLIQAIAIVRTFLDRHIARDRGSEISFAEIDSQTLDAIASTMSSSPALEQVCRIFELSSFERQILLCCVGQAIDPEFPNLFAIAHNQAELNYPTFQLTYQCFPDPHWNALTESRPLRQWQLVHCATSPELPRACLQIDEAILNYLMGEPYRDPLLSFAIAHYPSSPTPPPLQPSYEKIAAQTVAVLSCPPSTLPIVQLCGTLRESQRAIAVKVSEDLQLPLYRLSSDAIPSNRDELQNLVMRWQRWCTLDPGLLLVEVNSSFSVGDRSSRPLLDAFLQLLNVPVLVAIERRLNLSHPAVVTFEVMGLEYEEQLELWQAAWPDSDGDLARLAAQFRLSATMIETASATVRSDSAIAPEERGNRLWNFCRLQARPQLEGLAQRIDIRATWDDLVLPERETGILQQILTHVRQQARVYQNWGFAGKNQRGLGLSVLFAGASGTGKTTAAEVLAHELQLDLYRIDLSAVMSKYIGETEKNLRRIFDAAEVGGGILLFDEADALFGKRTQVKDSHDRHANIEVSYLLQRMESYQGLAILTTNLKDDLDRAFLRRLRFVVNFPYPKAPQRSQIWQRAFPEQTPTEGLNFHLLGQLDITGGNIKSIVLNAAFLAADADEPVMMKHILAATQTEYLKLGRSLVSTETRGWDI
ncbi:MULTISPECIES: AAA family ATPase [Spirulina sp. CCY15215]|uniref:ATP-binding protein n=1 Tax=Spirulina sp. CCY15215 TaxID=2767591 RepID=UPI00194FC070|nr:AAA family ATPase [Spirulina major]